MFMPVVSVERGDYNQLLGKWEDKDAVILINVDAIQYICEFGKDKSLCTIQFTSGSQIVVRHSLKALTEVLCMVQLEVLKNGDDQKM